MYYSFVKTTNLLSFIGRIVPVCENCRGQTDIFLHVYLGRSLNIIQNHIRARKQKVDVGVSYAMVSMDACLHMKIFGGTKRA